MSNLRKSAPSAPPLAQPLRISAEVMRALAHPLRMRILLLIDEKENICVTDLHAGLGIEQSLVSQHLRILRQAEVVITSRTGKFVYYALNYPRLAAAAKMASSLEAGVLDETKEKTT